MTLDVTSEEKMQSHITLMNSRITEGIDEAVYVIGMEQNGTPSGVAKEEIGQVTALSKHMPHPL
jgi:GTPase